MNMTPHSDRRTDGIETPGIHRSGSARRALAFAVLMTVFWASTAAVMAASADSALDAYEKGDFARARAEFERLAKERPDDPRYRFNAGDAAYRMRDFTNAAAHFESALASPDLKLQQGAYYNLGNSRYLIGEQAKDPQAKLQAWQQSLTNFSSALGLDPKDTNAASNLAYMRQRVEELMKQMPPPQQQQQKGDKDKDKKDDPGKDQQRQDQQSGDKQQDPQDKQKDSQSSKSDTGKDQDKGQAGKKGEQEDKKSEQAKSETKKDGKPEQGQKEKQQAQKQAGKETGKEGEDGEAQEASEAAAKPGEMSPAQAARLLDNQKAEEKALVFQSGDGKESRERKHGRKTW
jgi:Ca-activated chloride channel family protein